MSTAFSRFKGKSLKRLVYTRENNLREAYCEVRYYYVSTSQLSMPLITEQVNDRRMLLKRANVLLTRKKILEALKLSAYKLLMQALEAR